MRRREERKINSHLFILSVVLIDDVLSLFLVVQKLCFAGKSPCLKDSEGFRNLSRPMLLGLKLNRPKADLKIKHLCNTLYWLLFLKEVIAQLFVVHIQFERLKKSTPPRHAARKFWPSSATIGIFCSLNNRSLSRKRARALSEVGLNKRFQKIEALALAWKSKTMYVVIERIVSMETAITDLVECLVHET